MRRFLILGAGFTGGRVASLLRARGLDVQVTNRATFDVSARSFQPVAAVITPETVVLHSIPTIRTEQGLWDPTPWIVQSMSPHPPVRVIYLSTTGVYGAQHQVNEATAPAPRTERELLRVAAEQAVASGPWQSLILRPAAIYGPGRGVHAAMRAGTFVLADGGNNFVSRIQVDDLARHAEAAMLSDVTGAFPVADEQPCSSREAAAFCAELLGLPLPPAAPLETLSETRRADRRVDGSAIRRLLGISLRYPSYRTGFPACVAEEALARPIS